MYKNDVFMLEIEGKGKRKRRKQQRKALFQKMIACMITFSHAFDKHTYAYLGVFSQPQPSVLFSYQYAGIPCRPLQIHLRDKPIDKML